MITNFLDYLNKGWQDITGKYESPQVKIHFMMISVLTRGVK